MKLVRTDSTHPDFTALNSRLDAELAIRDGSDHAFYAQYNTIDNIRYVIVAYEDEQPVGCGALKEYAPGVMEIKRMFVPPGHRGKGIAGQVLHALESWARELKAQKCILETGFKQPEAIRLYKKSGYQVIPNYGQYEGVETSVCFEKELCP